MPRKSVTIAKKEASKRQEVRQVAFIQQHHTGPLPPPNDLARYEQIIPGLAERIVTCMESEQKNRHFTLKIAYLSAGFLPYVFIIAASVMLFFDPTFFGWAILGLGGISPIIVALLNRK
jgi:hypothetical protein